MPASGVFTTEKNQKWLLLAQNTIIKTSHRLERKVTALSIVLILVDSIRIYRWLKKVDVPTHKNVNQRNSHTLIDLRDWFLEHDQSQRNHRFYECFLNLVIVMGENLVIGKYEFDGHMGKRLEKWLEKWYEKAQAGEWVFTHKHPETEWRLNEEDKQEPIYIRQQRLVEALDNKEFDKVLNLID